jgi:hypothetical protein
MHDPTPHRRIVRSGPLLLLLGAALGCSGPDVPKSEKPDSYTLASGAGTALVLKDGVTYYTRMGIEPRPTDFSTSPPQLLVYDGGTPVFLSGTVTQPGTIHFDVPPGTYLIKHSNALYVQTSRRTVDLGYLRAGRPNRGGNPIPTSPGLTTLLELSGLQPATAPGPYANSFLFYSMDVEEVGEFTLSEPLSEGQTSLQDFNAEYSSFYNSIPRFDPAQQDSAWFLQTEGRDAGTPDGASTPWVYSTVVAADHLEPFAFNGDGPLLIEATLAPSPQRDLTFDWRRDEFAALRSASAPTSVNFGRLEVYPALQDARDGWIDYEVAPMLSFSPPYEDDAQTPIARTLTHGTAYPANWEPFAQFTMDYTFFIPNHDGSRYVTVAETFEESVPVSTLASKPLRPSISLPRDFQVDGQSALPSRILGSATPMVTWTAPALGSPSHYLLTIRRLNPPPRDFTSTVARIYLDADQRSLRIPPGVFVSGETYLLRLMAYASEERSPEVMAPRRFSLPHASAQTVSGLLTVP